jgi:hypothetical protein
MSKPITKEEEPKEKTFGEMFDFNNMFRVKGKYGLVSLIHHKKGSKTCVVCGIYEKDSARSESTDNMDQLSGYRFIKTDATNIGFTEVFNHMMKYTTTSEDYGFENITIEELMPWMVPNFDPDHFKLRHAETVLKWYLEITLKYSALIDDKVEAGEVELLTEEKSND